MRRSRHTGSGKLPPLTDGDRLASAERARRLMINDAEFQHACDAVRKAYEEREIEDANAWGKRKLP